MTVHLKRNGFSASCKLISYKVTIFRRSNVTHAEQSEKVTWIKPTGTKTCIDLYNPITKCKVPLILKNKSFLTWYSCGPTVYDSAHIGHAATYVKLDIVRRILSDFFNINSLLVMGITDIDDKIIQRSNELKQDFQILSRHYETEFCDDMKKLNVIKPYMYCRVSEYIPQIIGFIKKTIANGYGYAAKDGSIYFDTTKFTHYGKLSTPFSDTPHPDKKSALDFALWKSSKHGEPFWESPWGNGRPGWHIECSAIASSVFGETVDIHSGGIDLAFPHHENEEAQSCAHHGISQWVNYWLHCGHLCVKGDVKMSKSLKNTITISNFLEKYTANQFRLLCLLSHYRYGIDYSEETMDAVAHKLQKIEHFFNDCDCYVRGQRQCSDIDENVLLAALNETQNAVEKHLADDFNTAKAFQAVLQLVQTANKMLQPTKGVSESRATLTVAAVSHYVSTVLAKFGIRQETVSVRSDVQMNRIIEDFVQFRATVRKSTLESDVKDKQILAACDSARNNLLASGVIVKDYKNSSTWTIQDNAKV